MHRFANDNITYATTCTFVGAEGVAVAPYPISFAAIVLLLLSNVSQQEICV